jgi:hypothetical protein
MTICHSERQRSTVAINQAVFTWKSCSYIYFEQLLACLHAISFNMHAIFLVLLLKATKASNVQN